MIRASIDQDFKGVIWEIEVLPSELLGQFSAPQAMSIIYTIVSATGIMEDREQSYEGFINPSLLSQQQTIFLYLLPVARAMY